MKNKYSGVAIGAGYFSRFQFEAWNRITDVKITAICSLDDQGQAVAKEFGIEKHYTDYKEMIREENPDFVDVITPPHTHLDICKFAADHGVAIICQKPLAPSLEDARAIVDYTKQKEVPFMVHENWRFQPWYRKIKALINEDAIGKVHYAYFRSRMGDGWGKDAYIPRQPYFRQYPRLLIYENGIHFIDTFRYLFGEVSSVFSKLSRLNPEIKGEDQGLVFMDFQDGMKVLWDANRYNEPNHANPRYTFGELLIDGLKGSLRLYPDGKITIQNLGEKETEIAYDPSEHGFAGDSVYSTQSHFISSLANGEKFETNGEDYLQSIAVQEAVYRSSSVGNVVVVSPD